MVGRREQCAGVDCRQGAMTLTSKKVIKMFHIAGSIGMAGGLAAFMMVVSAAPDIAASEAYASAREILDLLSNWLILPSMVLVVFSGVISMAIHFPFHNAGWVWVKLLFGLLVFESTLASIDGPAQQALKAVERAMAGEISEAQLIASVSDKWGAWWVLLVIAALNVIISVWRPRFMKPTRGD